MISILFLEIISKIKDLEETNVNNPDYMMVVQALKADHLLKLIPEKNKRKSMSG